MHKNATKCNEILSKWCKNKHGASKIMDMFEMYHHCIDCIGLSSPRRFDCEKFIALITLGFLEP
jgi:hypothetical protein